MKFGSFKVNVDAMVLSHGRQLGEEREVKITEILEYEEFLVDKLDGTVSYNKSYPTSCLRL